MRCHDESRASHTIPTQGLSEDAGCWGKRRRGFAATKNKGRCADFLKQNLKIANCGGVAENSSNAACHDTADKGIAEPGHFCACVNPAGDLFPHQLCRSRKHLDRSATP